MTTIDKDDAGRIVSSEKRYAALKALAEEPMTPTALTNATKLYISDASNALASLREIECVELVVDESRRKGRIHGITDYGEAVLSYIDEETPNLRPGTEHVCPVCGQEPASESEAE